MSEAINWGELRQSLKDFTKIYKVTEARANSFVTWYIKRYRIQKGFDKEILEIVLNEIKRLQSEKA